MTISRRDILKVGGTAALFSAIKTASRPECGADPAGPEVSKGKSSATSRSPMQHPWSLQGKGFFAKHGMPDVEVAKQASWVRCADEPRAGLGRQRHRRRPYPDANALPDHHRQGDAKQPAAADVPRPTQSGRRFPSPTRTPTSNSRQAQSRCGRSAAKRAKGQEAKAAMTFPGGTHDLWIRYWLAAGGIDRQGYPDDRRAPPQMVANMKVGTMDVFCVGEPWNAQLVNQNIGYTAVNTGEIWTRHPEKSIAMRADWVDQHPRAAKALLLMAVMEAQQWCDKMENRLELCEIVGRRACSTCRSPTSSRG